MNVDEIFQQFLKIMEESGIRFLKAQESLRKVPPLFKIFTSKEPSELAFELPIWFSSMFVQANSERMKV